MMKRFPLAGLALLPLLFAGGHDARAGTYASVKGWDIEYHADRALFCGMSARFDDGVTFGLMLVRAAEGARSIGLVLSKPSWRMQRRGTDLLRVSVPGWFERTAETVVAETTILAFLPYDAKVVEGIAGGEALTILTPRNAYSYSLAGAGAAWEKTSECFESLQGAHGARLAFDDTPPGDDQPY